VHARGPGVPLMGYGSSSSAFPEPQVLLQSSTDVRAPVLSSAMLSRNSITSPERYRKILQWS
jgi:hypothetical protein